MTSPILKHRNQKNDYPTLSTRSPSIGGQNPEIILKLFPLYLHIISHRLTSQNPGLCGINPNSHPLHIDSVPNLWRINWICRVAAPPLRTQQKPCAFPTWHEAPNNSAGFQHDLHLHQQNLSQSPKPIQSPFSPKGAQWHISTRFVAGVKVVSHKVKSYDNLYACDKASFWVNSQASCSPWFGKWPNFTWLIFQQDIMFL